MVAISFNSVLIIAAISVLVPVVLGLLPRFPVPGVVLQVVAGIVVGPSVLGWARIDPAVEVLSDLGLGMLVLIGLALTRVRRLRGLDRLLDNLEERSGQLRVRATLTLALACGVLAYRFGFASILGAFAAGLLVRLIEFSGREPNPQFLAKLEGIGFGFLIPIFFISTGVAFQLQALLSHPVAIAEVPLFLIALLVGARTARAAVPALHGHPPRGGRGPAAGDHADVRDRGDGDRRRHREAHANRGRRARRRGAAIRGLVPGRGGAASHALTHPSPVSPRASPAADEVGPLHRDDGCLMGKSRIGAERTVWIAVRR